MIMIATIITRMIMVSTIVVMIMLHVIALHVLHMMCTRLRPGHLSVRVGDGSRRSEEIVKNLE